MIGWLIVRLVVTAFGSETGGRIEIPARVHLFTTFSRIHEIEGS